MKFLQFFLLLLFSLVSFAQELPPIQKYTTEDYGGDNQNWMLSQASNNFMYVANNRGLLEFNGAEWRLFPSPNNTVMRAVSVINDKIYTGCYAEFGFWVPDEFGVLQYVSLVPKLDKKMAEDEQVWNILDYDEWILFQTNEHIYLYNTKTQKIKTIKGNDIIYKLFKVNNKIYFHVANEGLYGIEGGSPKLIISGEVVEKGRIINLFERDNALMFVTRNLGFYKFENNQLKNWSIEADELLATTSVFASIQLKDGSFMLGTISNGLVHITKQGKVDYQITQKSGLGNNTVLSLFEDNSQNVWTGLDNGIDCVNVKSAVKTLFDYQGVLGTVYASEVFKEFLYIGTNQGLFYRKLNNPNDSFIFIKGTEGQVWNLFNYNDETLFCGHHLGTFTIIEDKALQISAILGAWDIKKIPNNNDFLLQGNYNGLHVLQKNNGIWEVRNKIDGFKNSARYFVLNATNDVWVNHEYKGVFKLKLDALNQKVIALTMQDNLSIGKNSGLISYDDAIIYASEKGIYLSDSKSNTFKKDSILSTLFTADNYLSGKLIVDKTGKLWAFTKDNLVFITKDAVTNDPKINNIFISAFLRKGPLGYENISLINLDKYLLGTANGYITIDLSKIQYAKEHYIYLNAITLQDFNDYAQKITSQKNGAFDYKQNIISFSYAVPEFDKFIDVKYQYKLKGLSDKWSKWTNESRVGFENLSFGDYHFEVRAKIGNQLSKNTVSYIFTIYRPWYLSNLAILFYITVIGFIGFITHKAYKRYYRKQLKHEQLENEQTIMKIKNERLHQDIESKNRELAISTMSIIKKNEVLNSIKKELKKTRKPSENNSAMELIDKNLNNSKDWQFFEKAFNNADKDFLEKIKLTHPDLTPNDLRFCAYLRLNLSSKEIAPLLNISIKSVETKRYRLRKRLNLEHDDSLVAYILKF